MIITETLLHIEGTCNRNEAKVIFHGKHTIYSPTKKNFKEAKEIGESAKMKKGTSL
jgi:hypothetical protein